MSKYRRRPEKSGFWDTDLCCFSCIKSLLLLWKPCSWF